MMHFHALRKRILLLFQRLGKALMLPVSVLPAAAILMVSGTGWIHWGSEMVFYSLESWSR